jgi:DNA-directed RNA polymerase I, II, and III subunit RPABC3
LSHCSSLTGAADDGNFNPASYSNSSLADNYEYVMHGRVFSIKHIEHQCVEVQASFGGLLFRLRGEQAHVESFAIDMT